jgi:adenylate kinase family enzyme
MIIKLHGTSGSGKTSVARGLMEMAGPITEIRNQSGSWPEAYMFGLKDVSRPVIVLGPYVSACGGLDCVPNVDDHMRMIKTYASHGNVFYESLLGSEYYGRIGKFTEQYGDEHVFAFLDTPIEVCIERVKKRREEAGNKKPLNEANTRGRIVKIERLKHRLIHEFHRRVENIDHTDAVSQVYKLFRNFNADGSSST